jgi:hypothetical protein
MLDRRGTGGSNLIASALASLALAACGGSGDTPIDGGSTSANDAAAQACVDDINAFRATINLPPYARWTEEESCAGQEAAMDAASGTPHSAFSTCTESAQDECPGWPGPPASMIEACLKMMWAEGPGTDFSTHGHYINMSSTQYTKVACGFTTLADGSVWAAQDFQ